MRPIIRVENLSKQYTIGAKAPAYSTIRESLMSAARKPIDMVRRNGKTEHPKFWALKDVSFDVMPGEVVGIIGRNGAGKSTLLKILSRITEPTEGRAELYGRVGSLLEVGTGFHGELTGRENIFLNGSILGMRREEISKKFDEIVDFAEIEDFLDTPVKRYSSGMYVRLAFAVAAHLEPEILIVDEVLAVGDTQFQKKCLGKMKDVSRHGRTILFVSHNLVAVESLCDRAAFIEKGQVRDVGPTKQVLRQYLDQNVRSSEHVWDSVDEAPGNDVIRLRRVAAGSPQSGIGSTFHIDEPCHIEIETWNLQRVRNVYFSIHLVLENGVLAFASPSPFINTDEPSSRLVCEIPADLLNAKRYGVQIVMLQDNVTMNFTDEIVSFEMFEHSRETEWYGDWEGATRPRLAWTVQ